VLCRRAGLRRALGGDVDHGFGGHDGGDHEDEDDEGVDSPRLRPPGWFADGWDLTGHPAPWRHGHTVGAWRRGLWDSPVVSGIHGAESINGDLSEKWSWL